MLQNEGKLKKNIPKNFFELEQTFNFYLSCRSIFVFFGAEEPIFDHCMDCLLGFLCNDTFMFHQLSHKDAKNYPFPSEISLSIVQKISREFVFDTQWSLAETILHKFSVCAVPHEKCSQCSFLFPFCISIFTHSVKLILKNYNEHFWIFSGLAALFGGSVHKSFWTLLRWRLNYD